MPQNSPKNQREALTDTNMLPVPETQVFDIIGYMRNFASADTSKQSTDSIAQGMIYHFFEGRKQDEQGHWHGTGYFYWQKVYREPGTGKRVKKGGKAFASCPDEERKRQYLADTGRIVESDTGRLQKVQRSTSPLFERTPASVYEIRG